MWSMDRASARPCVRSSIRCLRMSRCSSIARGRSCHRAWKLSTLRFLRRTLSLLSTSFVSGIMMMSVMAIYSIARVRPSRQANSRPASRTALSGPESATCLDRSKRGGEQYWTLRRPGRARWPWYGEVIANQSFGEPEVVTSRPQRVPCWWPAGFPPMPKSEPCAPYWRPSRRQR